MRKQVLLELISKKELPEEFEPTWIGQGYGYKKDVVITDDCVDDDEVVYIPEYGYENYENRQLLPNPESVYSKTDIIEICHKDMGLVEMMWETLDWQHPETLYDEWYCNGTIEGE